MGFRTARSESDENDRQTKHYTCALHLFASGSKLPALFFHKVKYVLIFLKNSLTFMFQFCMVCRYFFMLFVFFNELS